MAAPLLGGVGVGRFMERPLFVFRVHWDHEPWVCLTLTRNLTLTLCYSIKSRIKIKSKKSSADASSVAKLLRLAFQAQSRSFRQFERGFGSQPSPPPGSYWPAPSSFPESAACFKLAS